VFSTWEDPVIGGLLKIGAPLDVGALSDPDARGANLYTPGMANRLITGARQLGWDPASGVFVVSDGMLRLRSVIRKPGKRSPTLLWARPPRAVSSGLFSPPTVCRHRI